MRNILKSLILASSSLLILACGGGGSGVTSSANITVTTTKSTLDASRKNMSIDFLLTNSYSSNVDVQVKELAIAISPCEVQSSIFTPSEFTFDGTKQDIKVNAALTFVNGCTPTSYQLEGKTFLTLEGQTLESTLDSFTQDLNTSTTTGNGGNTDRNSTAIVSVADTTLPIIVIPNALKEINLTTNSSSISIPIKVFKDISPYTAGSVKVKLPTKVLSGIDVGLFTAYDVPVNEQGIAVFEYVGPSNLKALVENNDLSSIFEFYHTENSSDTKELKVLYSVSEDSYVPVDYSLSINTQDGDFSMGIPDVQKSFSINLKDSSGNSVDSTEITISKIEVSTENALIVQILNAQTGVSENSVLLRNVNASTFTLVSKKLSGIAPIRVVVEFTDINKEQKKLSTVVNVRVMSGPPSAISISYVSTSHDATRAKYEEKFAISVTDEYGNKVNTKPYISLGAIIGYAVDGRESSSVESNETKRLFYGKFDIDSNRANGQIDTLGDAIASTTNFEDNTANRASVFKWVNNEGINSDKLVVFGTGKNYEAMGKWDFSKLNDNTLSLEDDYFGLNRADLYYAVGHNYYQDQCAEDGREWLGSTDSDTYQLDEEGTVVVSYKYDYHLTGKDALVWVNLNGYQSDTAKNTRIGEVAKHTLRGIGLEIRPTAGYTIAKGTTSIVKFDIHHSAIAEWYQNARFAHAIVANTCTSVIEVDSSNWYDARSCNNGGVAYVTYEVTAPVDAVCNFNITDSVVANEF